MKRKHDDGELESKDSASRVIHGAEDDPNTPVITVKTSRDLGTFLGLFQAKECRVEWFNRLTTKTPSLLDKFESEYSISSLIEKFDDPHAMLTTIRKKRVDCGFTSKWPPAWEKHLAQYEPQEKKDRKITDLQSIVRKHFPKAEGEVVEDLLAACNFGSDEFMRLFFDALERDCWDILQYIVDHWFPTWFNDRTNLTAQDTKIQFWLTVILCRAMQLHQHRIVYELTSSMGSALDTIDWKYEITADKATPEEQVVYRESPKILKDLGKSISIFNLATSLDYYKIVHSTLNPNNR